VVSQVGGQPDEEKQTKNQTDYMKRMLKTVVVTAALAAAAAAQAQVAGDLFLGFNEPGSADDYVVDLGTLGSTLSATAPTTFGLSVFNISTFNSSFASSPNGVAMGVVGYGTPPNQQNLFVSAPLGSGTPGTLAHSPFSLGGGLADTFTSSPIGQLAPSGASSWTSVIAASPTLPGTAANNFVLATGLNPMASLVGGLGTLDIYESTSTKSGLSYGPPSAFALVGTVSFNYGSDSLTFTPAVTAVPEPATYGALAGLGLLALCLRRQLSRTA